MQEKSSIKQKILKYLIFKRVTKYNFYKNTGITRGVLDQNNGITEENIHRFLVYAKDISLSWLFLDKGEMILNETENTIVREPIEYYNLKECKFCEEKDKRIDALERIIRTQGEYIDTLKNECSSSESGQKRKAG